MVTPITYPARPVNGGPLNVAAGLSLRKTGDWIYEPKYNGWRTLIHVPTGTMFNREGKRLSIESEFADALRDLKQLHWGRATLEWVDAEGLERRHNLGRGCLIILDLVYPGRYSERRIHLKSCFTELALKPDFTDCRLFMPPLLIDSRSAWLDLQQINAELGVPFYEGLVAKRADSHYPVQLRSPKEEFPFWVKHRWAF